MTATGVPGRAVTYVVDSVVRSSHDDCESGLSSPLSGRQLGGRRDAEVRATRLRHRPSGARWILGQDKEEFVRWLCY